MQSVDLELASIPSLQVQDLLCFRAEEEVRLHGPTPASVLRKRTSVIVGNDADEQDDAKNDA